MGTDGLTAGGIKSSLKEFLSKPILPSASLGTLGDGDSFLEKGILDSTGVLELVSHLETQFGIRVESDEITPDNLDSLDKLADFVLRKRSA